MKHWCRHACCPHVNPWQPSLRLSRSGLILPSAPLSSARVQMVLPFCKMFTHDGLLTPPLQVAVWAAGAAIMSLHQHALLCCETFRWLMRMPHVCSAPKALLLKLCATECKSAQAAPRSNGGVAVICPLLFATQPHLQAGAMLLSDIACPCV